MKHKESQNTASEKPICNCLISFFDMLDREDFRFQQCRHSCWSISQISGEVNMTLVDFSVSILKSFKITSKLISSNSLCLHLIQDFSCLDKDILSNKHKTTCHILVEGYFLEHYVEESCNNDETSIWYNVRILNDYDRWQWGITLLVGINKKKIIIQVEIKHSKFTGWCRLDEGYGSKCVQIFNIVATNFSK